MKQINIVNAYAVTDKLTQDHNLSIQAKWVLYNIRKDLLSSYEFYVTESRNLFSQYDITVNGNTISFKTPAMAAEYKSKQNDIDNLDVDINFKKQTLKLSDIPSITVSDIETLEDFIEFMPE